MTPKETKALATIERTFDAARLRQTMLNARGRSETVEKAAFNRLISVSAGAESQDLLARECWEMVFAIEELRRLAGRKVWRMNRLRPTIEEKGVVAALEYCALNQTDGFEEVLAYGREDLLAESIVLRHPDRFSGEAVEAARRRLERAAPPENRDSP